MFKSIILYLSALIFFSACSNYNDVRHTPTFSEDINDTDSWYENMTNDVMRMSVSIQTPNSIECVPYDDKNASSRPCTLEDINNDLYKDDDYKPEVAVGMFTDDFGQVSPNAVLKHKGGYTRFSDLKSYRIKLDSKTELLNSERTMILNKHQSDSSRLKNKLAFDLFIDIPNLPSLKTEFVNLYVDENLTGEYLDYGLFTRVEEVKDEFLINRGWNEKDRIYKANNFVFQLSGDLSLDSSGEPKNDDAFDAILEVETGKDHTVFSKMNSAVNAAKTDIEFEEVFEKYFNRKNYITWMAVNLVIGNKDTIQHNYNLYNPLYGEKFYFLPWDYDGAWATKKYLSPYEYGYGVWWKVSLHKKFLSIKKNRDELDQMVSYLRENYFSTATIQSKLDSYEANIEPYILRLPDSEYLSYSTWQNGMDRLITGIQDNIDMYEEVEGYPMPFNQYISTDGLITWDESVDLENNTIVYEFKISNSVDMNETIYYSASNLSTREYKVDLSILEKGTYYLQVLSRETAEDGDVSHYQVAYGKHQDEESGDFKWGILEFAVE